MHVGNTEMPYPDLGFLLPEPVTWQDSGVAGEYLKAFRLVDCQVAAGKGRFPT